MQIPSHFKINSLQGIESHIKSILTQVKGGSSVTIELTIDAKTTRKYTCIWNQETQVGKIDRDITGTTRWGRFCEFWARNPGFNSSNATQLTNRLRAADKVARVDAITDSIAAAKNIIDHLCGEHLYGDLPGSEFQNTLTVRALRTSNTAYTTAMRAQTKPISDELQKLGAQSDRQKLLKMDLIALKKFNDLIATQSRRISALETIDKANRESTAIVTKACAEDDYLYQQLAIRVTQHVKSEMETYETTAQVATTIPTIRKEPVCEMLLSESGDNQPTYFERCVVLFKTPDFPASQNRNALIQQYATRCNAIGDLLSDATKSWDDIKKGIENLSAYRTTLDQQIETGNNIAQLLSDPLFHSNENSKIILESLQGACSLKPNVNLLESNEIKQIQNRVQAMINKEATQTGEKITDFLKKYENQSGFSSVLNMRFDEQRQNQITELRKMIMSCNNPTLGLKQLNVIITQSGSHMASIAEWNEEQGALEKLRDVTANVIDSFYQAKIISSTPEKASPIDLLSYPLPSIYMSVHDEFPRSNVLGDPWNGAGYDY